MELADFLLARIAEDEAAALVATPGPWQVSGEHREATVADSTGAPVLDAGGEYCGDLWLDAYDTDLAHIARHDPARVIARCKADRQILEREARFFEPRDDLPPDLTVVEDEWRSDREWVWVKFATGAEEQMSEATYRERFMRPAVSKTMRFLALPYADHPDFREEWRP